MPPGPVPWDRKDFFRQRKHERSEQSFGFVARWRDSSTTSSSSNYAPREFSRWGSGDIRRPPGHGKQGGWHQCAEETCHLHAPSRSGARMFEDENYRPNASHGDWRYNRYGRDRRVSFSHRNWKSRAWDMNDGSSSAIRRPRDTSTDRSTVDDRSFHPSDPYPNLVNSGNQPHSKDKACPPQKPFEVNGDHNSGDKQLSFSSNPHFGPGNSYDQPTPKDLHDNKVDSPGRACDVNIDKKTIDCSSSHPLTSHSELPSTLAELHYEDQQEGVCCNLLNTGKRCERENFLGSIDWKQLGWTRFRGSSSWGSGFTHSSSSKSLGAVDSSELKTESLAVDGTSIQFLSGDAAACLMSAVPLEEMNSRKKPRLGWGEGLAKYEKKKVEGPDENSSKDGNMLAANSEEELHSLGMNLVDENPVVVGFSDCASPATPCSVAYKSSPGTEDRSGRGANTENSVNNLCPEGFPFNLENLDNVAIVNLCHFLNELLHSDDPGLVDSNFVRSTSLNKVLVWKSDILKALEVTESEIELLENDLKTLKLELGSLFCHLAASSSFSGVANANLSEQQEVTDSLILGPAPLQFDFCLAEMGEKMPTVNAALDEVCVDAKDEGVDSPGTATSNLCEPPSFLKASPLSHAKGHFESSCGMLGTQSVKSISSSSKVLASACGDGCLPLKGEIVELASSGISLGSDGVEIPCTVIFASNKESANEASEVFNKLLPRKLGYDGNSLPSNVSCSRIKQKVAVNRQLLTFKERVLAFKFKAFQRQWKEDMRLLSIRKHRAKSQKNCLLSLRIKLGGYQKLRSSIRSRFMSPAAETVSLVPIMELVSFAGKLRSDSQLRPHRDHLKMPALILDRERMGLKFISCNGLVEDPRASERERAMINPWTSVERDIFLDKLAIYGKDFRKIASYLDHKTTADCVEFYYKNQKSDCFAKIKKLNCSKQGKCNYMVAPGKKWDCEMSDASLDILGTFSDMAAPLDILGTVSEMAARANKITAHKQPSSNRIILRGCNRTKSSQLDDNGFVEHSHPSDLCAKETVAADVLASSCITTSIDPREGYEDQIYKKPNATVKESQMSYYIMQNDDDGDDDDACSEENGELMDPHHWSDEERFAFMQAFSTYGKDFARISYCLGTRSRDECRVFFSKLRKRLGFDSLPPLSGNVSTSVTGDANGGGSETEACVMETSSVICSDELAAKMDGNLLSSPGNTQQEELDRSGPVKLKTDLNMLEQENGMVLTRLNEIADLVDSDSCHTGDKLDLASEVGSDMMNIKTVGNQCWPAQLTKNSDLLCLTDKRELVTGQEVLVSARASSGPASSSNTSTLANAVAENFTEISGKDSEAQNLLLPETNLSERDRTKGLTHLAEDSTSSSFKFSECLHHVPIKVSMEDPLAFCLPWENSTAVSNSESPDSHIFEVEEQPYQDRKEVNSYNGCRKLTEAQSTLKSNVCATTACLGQNFALRKCSSSIPNGSKAKHSRKDYRFGHPRRLSHSLSDTEKPGRNGNVKLFGKILTSYENDTKEADHPLQNGRSPTQKVTSRHNLTITSSDNINQLGLQNVPITSYGFWDGNRIRTGFSSLPDSATLLAKYPDAFSSYSASSSTFKQQALQSISKSNGIIPNGFSVHTRKEMNGMDFQRLTDHNSARVEQGTSSRMHRQNGFENDVSDPVATIKLHCAKNEQNGSIVRGNP